MFKNQIPWIYVKSCGDRTCKQFILSYKDYISGLVVKINQLSSIVDLFGYFFKILNYLILIKAVRGALAPLLKFAAGKFKA